MSDHPERFEEDIEEGEEAFIDLEDPNVEIVDDVEGDVSGDESEDDESGEGFAATEGSGNEEDLQDDDEAMQQAAEVEDLNAVPDREPERDDAVYTFQAPERKPVHAVAVYPQNAAVMAVGGEGEDVYILHLDDQAHSGLQLNQTLTGHTDTVSLVSFSPNGSWLATAGLDSTVRIWSTSTWEEAHCLSDLYGEILTLLWHPSSLILTAGADDAQAAMWNVAKGTLIMYFAGHRGPITTTLWSPDAKKLLTGSGDGSVSVFNPKTGEQEVNVSKNLSPDNAGVTTMCFVNDDQCIVGCEDGTIHVVSLNAAKGVAHFQELHEQAIESMQANATRTLLLTASCDCKVVVWKVSDFSPRVILEVGESVIPACWVQTHLIAAGCSDGDIRVWDGRSIEQEPLQVCMGHRRMILNMTVSGNMIVTASDDGTTKLFRVNPPLEA